MSCIVQVGSGGCIGDMDDASGGGRGDWDRGDAGAGGGCLFRVSVSVPSGIVLEIAPDQERTDGFYR